MLYDVKKGIKNMLRDIEQEVMYTQDYIGKDRLKPEVMEAMAKVPRHKFVPMSQKALAYHNGPLSIGCGQTISQPYIVALMTDMLNVDKNSAVLEIGTGSGYQTAILSTLVKKVYSMEAIPELMENAKNNLNSLGYHNIDYYVGDGHDGWPEHAPYDGIIVTAAAAEIPEALIEQLKVNAHMVIPVGPSFGAQELIKVTKYENNDYSCEDILAVAFVPLVKTSHTQSV